MTSFSSAEINKYLPPPLDTHESQVQTLRPSMGVHGQSEVRDLPELPEEDAGSVEGEILELPVNQIVQGNTLDVLKTFPSESIDCVITSPPYFALRDYKTEPIQWPDGWKGSLGLEPTFELYIKHLCDIFDEAKRVLKNSGTCWVVLADTYARASNSVQQKSLCLIPFRFAVEMCNRGWVLRNLLLWWKPSCLPSSAHDRFTIDFEPVLFFSKNKNYYFETQYEPLQSSSIDRLNQDIANQTGSFRGHAGAKTNGPIKALGHPSIGRIKRCVWRINPDHFSGAHFAVFPPELVETPLKAGCPEFVCNKCGKPREKVWKVVGHRVTEAMRKAGSDAQGQYSGQAVKDYASAKAQNASDTKRRILESMSEIREFSWSSCSCNAGFSPGIVLDPFMGAGTTALVAVRNNRSFVGIELNPDYVKMAEERIKPLLNLQKQKLTAFVKDTENAA